MFAMAALGFASSLIGGLGARSAAQAQTIINKANAEAENRVREANNVVRSSQAALTNYIRAEDSKRKFKAAGEAYTKAGQNIVRIRDQAVRGTVAQKLVASQELGALTAQAAAMGLGGSSVDMIAKQIRTSARGRIQDAEDAIVTQVNDINDQRVNLMDNANAASEQGQAFAGIDYSKAMPAFVAKPSFLSIAVDAFSNPAVQKYMQVGFGQQQMDAAGAVRTGTPISSGFAAGMTAGASSYALNSGNYVRLSI